MNNVSLIKVKSILNNFKSAFSKIDKKKGWSILDTDGWKKKERKYIKRNVLSSLAGSLKGTSLDDDELWRDILKRHSRKKAVNL